MKKIKFSGLALAVLAGGAIAASAATAKTQQGSTFEISINFSNSPPSLINVSDIPHGTKDFNVTNEVSFADRIVDTDGSGKIDGVVFLRLASGTATTTFETNVVGGVTNIVTNVVATTTAYSDLIGDVAGKISSGKAGAVTITERVKASGYSAAAGSNGVTFPAFATLAGASSLGVNFKSTAAPIQDTNTGQSTVTG